LQKTLNALDPYLLRAFPDRETGGTQPAIHPAVIDADYAA
jgi:hypothetical protein